MKVVILVQSQSIEIILGYSDGPRVTINIYKFKQDKKEDQVMQYDLLLLTLMMLGEIIGGIKVCRS